MNKLPPGAMVIWHVPIATLCMLAAPGCGSSSGAMDDAQQDPTSDADVDAPDEPICDGSDRLRLRSYYEPDFFREPPESAVLIELGHYSIGIDGHCRYWMNGSWTNGRADRHLPWKTGTLPEQLVLELDEAINLRALDSLECEGSTTFSHKDYYSIRSEHSRRSCEVGLDSTKFFDIYRILDERDPELYAAGMPMDGPLHLAVFNQPWPLEMQYEWPVDSIAIDTVQTKLEPGHSVLVTDPEAVRLMRQLRDNYVADITAPDAVYNWPTGIPLTAGVQVFMRDAVPYELPNGLWPWSDE